MSATRARTSLWALLATSFALIGCAAALTMPFGRLGNQGEVWGLLTDCPVCIQAARFLGPVASISAATKAGLWVVVAASVLSLMSLLALLTNHGVTSVSQVWCAGWAGFLLPAAAVVFYAFLPAQVPVHLAYGAWISGTIGALSCVLALGALKGLGSEDGARGHHQERGGWADEEDAPALRSGAAASSAPSTYGAIKS